MFVVFNLTTRWRGGGSFELALNEAEMGLSLGVPSDISFCVSEILNESELSANSANLPDVVSELAENANDILFVEPDLGGAVMSRLRRVDFGCVSRDHIDCDDDLVMECEDPAVLARTPGKPRGWGL